MTGFNFMTALTMIKWLISLVKTNHMVISPNPVYPMALFCWKMAKHLTKHNHGMLQLVINLSWLWSTGNAILRMCPDLEFIPEGALKNGDKRLHFGDLFWDWTYPLKQLIFKIAETLVIDHETTMAKFYNILSQINQAIFMPITLCSPV